MTQSNTILRGKLKNVQYIWGANWDIFAQFYLCILHIALQGPKKDDFELPACMKIAETVAIVGL